MSNVTEKRDARVPQLKKLYHSIGEVSELIGVPAHVLRYWESEFPQLHPKKGRGGNRLYTENDLTLLAQIHELLHGKKFTIAGARKQLALGLDDAPEVATANGDVLSEVKSELKEILKLLDTSGRGAAR